MTIARRRIVVIALSAATACARRDLHPVESLSGGPDVSRYALRSLAGTRDGDRMDVAAIYSNGSNELTVNLLVAVGSPTRLQSGTWSGPGGSGNGTVRERSLTFLGGQSGPPSIGGRFDLVDRGGTPRFRVVIQLQPLRR